MTQERIQKAAIETRCAVAMSLSGDGYSSVDLIPYIQDDLSYDDFIEESFAKGADWRINSVWHTNTEMPSIGIDEYGSGKDCLVKPKYGVIENGQVLFDEGIYGRV